MRHAGFNGSSATSEHPLRHLKQAGHRRPLQNLRASVHVNAWLVTSLHTCVRDQRFAPVPTFGALAAHPFIDGDAGSLNRHNARLKREGYVTIEKRFVDNKPQTTIALTDLGRQAFERHCRALGKIIKAMPEEAA